MKDDYVTYPTDVQTMTVTNLEEPITLDSIKEDIEWLVIEASGYPSKETQEIAKEKGTSIKQHIQAQQERIKGFSGYEHRLFVKNKRIKELEDVYETALVLMNKDQTKLNAIKEIVNKLLIYIDDWGETSDQHNDMIIDNTDSKFYDLLDELEREVLDK